MQVLERKMSLGSVWKAANTAILLSILLFSSKILPAQTNVRPEPSKDVPAIVLDGLKAYKEKGPDEAVRAWIKGSAIDGSKDALTQANNLRQIQDYYGAYRDFEIVAVSEITTKTRAVYVVIDFEKGPLFAKFVVYRPQGAWILVNFNFNTKEEAILPTAVHER
jgi:hypothetical protein